MTISYPPLILRAFASGGEKNAIQDAAYVDPNDAHASWEDGFPPVTRTRISLGGHPPYGKDFNGVLYDVSSHTLWVEAGGQYKFDAALATEIGGYPIGMVLQSDDGTSAYVSAVANNSINFNSSPASIGVEWMPWSGNAVSDILQNPNNDQLLYFVGQF